MTPRARPTLPVIVLGQDRYRPSIWAIRRDGETVRRGEGKLWARWWLFWERRREP